MVAYGINALLASPALTGTPTAPTQAPGDTSTAIATDAFVAAAAGLGKLAATPLAGFALQNGTPTIISWTAPNDGKLHRFLLSATQHVTSAQTGGGVNVTYTAPDGSAGTLFPFGAGNGVGVSGPLAASQGPVEVEAGSTVTVVQGGALTAGAATVWAELWGS